MRFIRNNNSFSYQKELKDQSEEVCKEYGIQDTSYEETPKPQIHINDISSDEQNDKDTYVLKSERSRKGNQKTERKMLQKTLSPDDRGLTLKKKRSGNLKSIKKNKERFEDISKKNPTSNICQFYRYEDKFWLNFILIKSNIHIFLLE